MTGALPTFLIIGAMKCGTTALHRILGDHPQVGVSEPKELNWFFGTDPPCNGAADPWAHGNHWRGVAWYADHFTVDTPFRGEASPGYTSPSHPGAAARIADLLPGVRLVYLVRDPVARAVSQYHHHRRDGAEARSVRDALLDPDSQYVARSRYHERLVPFLDRFPGEQLLVLATEELRRRPHATVTRLLGFLGADPGALPPGCLPAPARVSAPTLDPALHRRLGGLLRDDADRLRRLTGVAFTDWSL